MKLTDYTHSRTEAEDRRIEELEASHDAELAALVEEIYNEDLEVIG